MGSRVAVKPTPVPAARVWELVRQLDNELLSSTVGAILEEHRRTTQARADALRRNWRSFARNWIPCRPTRGSCGTWDAGSSILGGDFDS